MPKHDVKRPLQTTSGSDTTDGKSLTNDHSLFAMANELLNESAQNEWQNILILTRKMTHTALGYGYFALAVTLKKLYWSLVPQLNESQVRKYALRTVWSLARAKRENDFRFLIHRNSERYKLRKQGGTVTQLVKFHNFDPDSVVPPAHELAEVAPHVAQLLTQVNDETPKPQLHHANHHDILQPPHITLAIVSNVADK